MTLPEAVRACKERNRITAEDIAAAEAYRRRYEAAGVKFAPMFYPHDIAQDRADPPDTDAAGDGWQQLSLFG